jgi:hypothetical protein
MPRDLVLLSMHEKGFWQADLYLNGCDIPAGEWEAIGPSPDEFMTMKKGTTLLDAMHRAGAKWPQARIDLAAEADDEDDDTFQ